MRDAAQQVSEDLGYCVNFTTYQDGSNQPFISIQPTGTGTQIDICTTFYGYAKKGGTQGQVMVMFGGAPGGCLDNKRDAMRLWSNSLGLLNEYLRSDRDPIMTFASNRNSLVATNLQKYDLFNDVKKLNATTAMLIPPNGVYQSIFDLNSITMITGDRFAASSSQPVFTITGGNSVGQNARLSENDCRALKILYGCSEPGYGPTPFCSSRNITLII